MVSPYLLQAIAASNNPTMDAYDRRSKMLSDTHNADFVQAQKESDDSSKQAIDAAIRDEITRGINDTSQSTQPVQAAASAQAQPSGSSNYQQRVAQIESGNNPNAQNPNSSAKGRYQFIGSTANQYGITAPAGTPEYQQQEAQAEQRFTQDNANELIKMGIEPNDGILYLAHQQGAHGAAKLLKNPQARAVDLVGHDSVVFNGGTPDMTAAQFAQIQTGRFGQPLPSSFDAPPKFEQLNPHGIPLSQPQNHQEPISPDIARQIHGATENIYRDTPLQVSPSLLAMAGIPQPQIAQAQPQTSVQPNIQPQDQSQGAVQAAPQSTQAQTATPAQSSGDLSPILSQWDAPIFTKNLVQKLAQIPNGSAKIMELKAQRDQEIQKVLTMAAAGDTEAAKYLAKSNGLNIPEAVFSDTNVSSAMALAGKAYPKDPDKAQKFFHAYMSSQGNSRDKAMAAMTVAGPPTSEDTRKLMNDIALLEWKRSNPDYGASLAKAQESIIKGSLTPLTPDEVNQKAKQMVDFQVKSAGAQANPNIVGPAAQQPQTYSPQTQALIAKAKALGYTDEQVSQYIQAKGIQ